MICPSCRDACPDTARHCPQCGNYLLGTRTQPTTPVRPSPYTSHTSVASLGGTMMLASGTVLQGRYRIEAVLGSGAFGRVYRATDDADPTHPAVAIKELLDHQFATPTDKGEAISWFKREVSTLLTLDHPNIPAIYGYWTARATEGPFYLAMDYVPGKTLDDVLLDRGGRVPWSAVVEWGITLCDVLTYLHQQTPPFIFRDIKLANVILDSRTNQPVLIDFGIARQMATAAGTAIGTWGYVPFEQVMGRAEPRSDIYALGALLHALVTGRHPDSEYTRLQRQGLDVQSAMRALFPHIDTIVPGTSSRLGDVLRNATAFSAADRFTTAEGMASALRSLLNGNRPAISRSPLAVTLPPASASTSSTLSTAPAPIPASAPPPARPTPPASVPIPQTLVVSQKGGAAFTSISAALDVANAGTVIEVRPGRYSEVLIIDKDIEIVGVGSVKDIIVENTDADCLTMRANRATVRGLTLRSWAGLKNQEHHAIAIPRGELSLEECHVTSDSLSCISIRGASTRATIKRCRIHDGKSTGIDLGDHASAVIQDCEIISMVREGLLATEGTQPIITRSRILSCKDDGIHIHSGSKGRIDGCEIARTMGAGVRIGQDSTITMQRTTLREDAYGIVFQNDATGTVEDCVINACTKAQIGITNGAYPTLRRCKIQNGRESGIVVQNDGRAIIEECDIANAAQAGLVLGRKCAMTITRCQVHDGQGMGFHIQSDTKATIEDCTFLNNANTQIFVQGSAPTIRNCRFRRGQKHGLLFSEHSHGIVEGCEVFGHVTEGIMIATGSGPTIHHCRIYGGQDDGVLITEGAGVIEDCQVYDNGNQGIRVMQRSYPTIRRCVIHNSAEGGLIVQGESRGTFEECDVYASKSGIAVTEQSAPVFQRCKIHDNRSYGVAIDKKGRVSLTKCEIWGNSEQGAVVQVGSDATFAQCRICDNGSVGIAVQNDSLGTVHQCHIARHEQVNVYICDQSAATVRSCTIQDGDRIGILFSSQSRGTIIDTTLEKHAAAGILIGTSCAPQVVHCTIRNGGQGILVQEAAELVCEDSEVSENVTFGVSLKHGSVATIRRCRINRNDQAGIYVEDKCSGSVEDCDLAGNAQGAWQSSSRIRLHRKRNVD